MHILKFGGSSVANADSIKRVIQIVRHHNQEAETTVVIVSALGGVTDTLIELTTNAAAGKDISTALGKLRQQHLTTAKALFNSTQYDAIKAKINNYLDELEGEFYGLQSLHLQTPSLRMLDQTMSFGERLSAFIVGESFAAAGLKARCEDARKLIRTNALHGAAEVNFRETNKRLRKYFNAHPGITVLGGFIASTPQGLTTTLGRGGSDYTAAIVGAALKAEEIQIWTDVDGVMTADPRKVPKAFPLEEISYEEAGELAHFGAKVIHPKTMLPARVMGIPIRIKNTFNPNAHGTLIHHGTSPRKKPIEGISTLDHISLVTVKANNGLSISEVVFTLFQTLARADVDVILTTQASSEQSITVALMRRDAKRVETLLVKKFELELSAKRIKSIEVRENLAIVAIVGKQMRGIPNISGRMFSTLGASQVNVIAIAQGSSELNVSAVIRASDQTKAVQALHQNFFGPTENKVPLFLFGTGGIGSTLLKQIQAISTNQQLFVMGITNSQQQLLTTKGVNLKKWESELNQGEIANLQSFLRQIKQHPGAIAIDCTASEKIASHYADLLQTNISIVAANKKANSGSQKKYDTLKHSANQSQGYFQYETNVGAGLPILKTLRSLTQTGDKIISIEGILSGTLSYIFNTFAETDRPFSEIVLEAKEKGYTEPDPRDDLCGLDVARKLLILAREIGQSLELEDITIRPLLSTELFEAPHLDAFFKSLSKSNDAWETKRQKMRAKNQKLLPIAKWSAQGASFELTTINSNHPFYGLSGSDNIIAFTTTRYQTQPLVIRGPGAGAEVTAAGVLADILEII